MAAETVSKLLTNQFQTTETKKPQFMWLFVC